MNDSAGSRAPGWMALALVGFALAVPRVAGSEGPGSAPSPISAGPSGS